jgi:hypothetical protein
LFHVQIDPNWEDDSGAILGYTVDGIHYSIEEPRPFKTLYKSHKLGSAGLDYELVVCTFKPKLAGLRGPFPSGVHDITVFKEKGLKEAIERKQESRGNDFRVIADDGYFSKDLTRLLSYRNELDPREIAWFKDRALSRHESFNGKTKVYRCLTSKFRHDRGDNPDNKHPMHQACVEAICVTLQCEMDCGVLTLLDPYPT